MNTAKPLVSAIIPTYNYGQYLSHALDSILAQEGLGEQFDIEIIVVDDIDGYNARGCPSLPSSSLPATPA